MCAPRRHRRSVKSSSRFRSAGFSSLSFKIRSLCASTLSYSARIPAYCGRSWHRAASRNLRRAAAPARTRNRSSGQNNTVRNNPRASLWRRSRMPFWKSSIARSRCSRSSSVISRPSASKVPRMRPWSQPKRRPSFFWAVRNSLMVDRAAAASSRLVLPWAFSPTIRLTAGSKARLAAS